MYLVEGQGGRVDDAVVGMLCYVTVLRGIAKGECKQSRYVCVTHTLKVLAHVSDKASPITRVQRAVPCCQTRIPPILQSSTAISIQPMCGVVPSSRVHIPRDGGALACAPRRVPCAACVGGGV